jgi:ABC-type metal ion transport system substrate-binding protein
MIILNFGEKRSKIINKVLGVYYEKFDRDVNIYIIEKKDIKKITDIYSKNFYGYSCYNKNILLIENIKEHEEVFFIENIRNESKFLYLLINNIIIEIGRE